MTPAWREHTDGVFVPFDDAVRPNGRSDVTEPSGLTSDPICTADRRGGVLMSFGTLTSVGKGHKPFGRRPARVAGGSQRGFAPRRGVRIPSECRVPLNPFEPRPPSDGAGVARRSVGPTRPARVASFAFHRNRRLYLTPSDRPSIGVTCRTRITGRRCRYPGVLLDRSWRTERNRVGVRVGVRVARAEAGRSSRALRARSRRVRPARRTVGARTPTTFRRIRLLPGVRCPASRRWPP
jgi:hypothetical protein